LTAAERLESETVAENNPTAKAAKEQQINSWKQTAAQYESEPETQEGRKELAERAKYAEERRSWKLLQLQPKSPTIIAPRLRTDGLGSNDFAVAGGGNVAGMAIANFRDRQGSARSPEEAKAIYEREKNDIEYPFSLSDYKQSCAVYVRGQKVSRRQLVLYVAHKKRWGSSRSHAKEGRAGLLRLGRRNRKRLVIWGESRRTIRSGTWQKSCLSRVAFHRPEPHQLSRHQAVHGWRV
jgi:hypothetical protein